MGAVTHGAVVGVAFRCAFIQANTTWECSDVWCSSWGGFSLCIYPGEYYKGAVTHDAVVGMAFRCSFIHGLDFLN